MRRFVAAALLWLGLIAPASAQHQDALMNADDVMRTLRLQRMCPAALSDTLETLAAARPYREAKPLTGDERTRVVAWYNSLPPATDFPYDLVVVIEHEDGAVGLLLGFGVNVCNGQLVPPDVLPTFMRVLKGDPA
jgi:hypothetical protein